VWSHRFWRVEMVRNESLGVRAFSGLHDNYVAQSNAYGIDIALPINSSIPVNCLDAPFDHLSTRPTIRLHIHDPLLRR
jgi:hypothetical protein